MAVSRLTLYNGSLRELGERRLASLSEDREARHVLDDVWNSGDGILKFVLQAKQWRFARRTVSITADTSIDPGFGYQNAFPFPSDHVRTCAVCSDEFLNTPLLQYHVENGYWYSDIDPIYVSYTSNHADYGLDYTKWPPNFTLWVETHLASLICLRLAGSEEKANRLIKLADLRLKKAANTDAMEEPARFMPLGTFARARLGGHGATDRGSRSRLIG